VAPNASKPPILWGHADARIRNLNFQNLTAEGKPVTRAEFFKTEVFVDALTFETRATAKPSADAPTVQIITAQP
jgi:hypothetical protein